MRKFEVTWEDNTLRRGDVYSKGNLIGSVLGIGWNPTVNQYHRWVPVFRCASDSRLLQVSDWSITLKSGSTILELLCWLLLISTTHQQDCLVETTILERRVSIEE